MKLTIGKKLGLAFGTIFFLMLVSAVATSFRANEIGRTQSTMAQMRIPAVTLTKELQRDLNQTQSKGRQEILAGPEPARRDAAQKLFDSAWSDVERDTTGLAQMAPNWSNVENRDRLARIREQLPKLREVQEEGMNKAASGDRDAVIKGGNEFADKATSINEDIKKSLGEMADSNEQLLEKDSKRFPGQPVR